LLRYAKAQFELSKPGKNGEPLIKQLHDIYIQTGQISPQLEKLPMLPIFTSHIWKWFCELSRTRSSGFAVQSISWGEIAAYFSLKGITPQRWEVDALVRVDVEFMNSRDAPPMVTDAKALKMADVDRVENRRG
jgi:hypothetical protein